MDAEKFCIFHTFAGGLCQHSLEGQQEGKARGRMYAPHGGGAEGCRHGGACISGAGAFYDAPVFSGNSAEAAQVAAAFPDADGATLRTVGDGVIEASSDGGVSRWYNSAYYDEPDAPHSTIQASNGVEWYAMQQHAETPPFEAGDAADGYNRAQFQSFIAGL